MIYSRSAFTMIEIIFVIVIIGILSAVAIPKLTATRDDASVSLLISHTKNTLNDFQAFYTSQGNSEWKNVPVTEATDVPLQRSNCSGLVDASIPLSPSTFALCNQGIVCLSFTTTNDGNLTITNGTVTTNAICEALKNAPPILTLSNRTYRLGGTTVHR